MTYSDLNIHQKINAKGNALVYWGDKPKRVYRRRHDPIWDVEMYGPLKLSLTGFNFKEPQGAGRDPIY